MPKRYKNGSTASRESDSSKKNTTTLTIISVRVATGTDRLGTESNKGNTLLLLLLRIHNDVVFDLGGRRRGPGGSLGLVFLGPSSPGRMKLYLRAIDFN